MEARRSIGLSKTISVFRCMQLAAREKGKVGTEAKVRTTQTSNSPLTARGLEYAGREERKNG